MTNGNQSDERAIFLAALEQGTPQAREGYLQRACAGNPDLLHRLLQLLAAHDASQGPMDAPPPGLGGDRTIDAPRLDHPGMQIGPYKLLQQIGEGGMGVVYMAEQHEPVRRKVALKIIKPGMDTRQVIARFEAERQALSLMDHPNIARVLDAGTTEGGRPYFVMELVRGQPITEYCDEHHLTPRQRLEMLLPVCQAIQHAHQKGIIHRDIKPSNILVAEYDQQAVPKVIDFGVAKATSQPLTEKTMFTGFGQVVGTLEYMSPEQAKVNQLDIDTRSDIYSLGVLLYELLTGTTPFDKQRLRSAAWDEMLRIIREEEPPKPSTRLSTIDTLPSVAANRQTEPGKLSGILRGELDWIVMKALDKDRNRRYETANGLAMDLLRYLHDEPVVACPPSATYRFRKFARRNRAVLLTGALLASALLLGTTISIWQAIRATTAEREASQLLVSEQAAHQEADQARMKEAEQRRAAEQAGAAEAQQRLAAENERVAAEEAQKAAEAAGQEADEQRQLASERELLARRNLYAAHMNLAQEAWDETDIPRALDLLQRHVPAPGEPDWRSFEWYHLLGLCNQDELTFDRASSSDPAFSPDGKVLAVSRYGTQIELWDLERRESIQVISDTTFGPLAYSPDGKTLASVSRSEVRLWDIVTGTLIRSFEGHEHVIGSLAFAPDGASIISVDGGDLDTKNTPGVIRVWETSTGKLMHELKGYSTFITSIAVSPDGARLASGGFDGVRLWDLQAGKPIEGFKISGGWFAVAWSPDGKSLATYGTDRPYDPGDIMIWDSTTGRNTARFPAPGIRSLTYSPDSQKLASAHGDCTVRLWEINTGKELAVFKGHTQGLSSVTFSPDGKRLASYSRDAAVKVWLVQQADSTQALAGAPWKQESVPGRDRMRLSPDGSLLAAMQDASTVAMIDVRSGDIRAKLQIGAEVHALSFSPDGQRIAVAHSRGMSTWDVTASVRLQDRPTATSVWTIDYAPDGASLAVGTEERQVEICDAETLVRRTILPWRYKNPLRKVAYSPDGKHLAAITTIEPAEMHIWDIEQGRLQTSMEYSDKYGMDLAFSPDGRILAVSEGILFNPHDGAVTRLFEVAGGTQVALLQGDDAYHSAVTFSKDGNTLITASETGKITLWDLATFEERATFRWNGHRVESLALTPDGRTLASSDNHARIRIWRPATDQRIGQTESAGLFGRATQYVAADRIQEALELFTQVLARGEKVGVRESRARSYAEIGMWDEAIADLEQAMKLGAKNYRLWYELALLQLMRGDTAAYEQTCADMLSAFGTTNSAYPAEFLCWTNTLRLQPNLDWGQLVAIASVPFNNGDAGASARRTLGAVLLRAGLFDDAVAELEATEKQVLQERNRTPAEYDWYLLAQAHAHLGDMRSARDYLGRTQPLPSLKSADRSVNYDDHGPQWFRRATLQLLRSETEALLAKLTTNQAAADKGGVNERSQAALKILSRAIELQNDAPLLWRLRARAHERIGSHAEAVSDRTRAEQLEKLLPLRRLDALVSGNRGGDVVVNKQFVLERAEYRFRELADCDGALQDCVRFLRYYDSPDYRKGLDLLLEVHEARGTLDSADGDWLRAFGDGQLAKFYRARADYYRRQSQHEKAQADSRRLAWDEAYPHRHDAWTARSDTKQQTDPWPHLLQARDHRLLEELDQAEAQLAMAAAANDSDVWLAIADLQQTWDVDAAVAESSRTQAIQAAGDNPLPWIHRGRWYADQGQHEKADADFAKAASLTPHELNKFLTAGWWVVGPYPAELKEFCPPEVDPDPSRPVHVIDPQTGLSDELVKWQTVPTAQWGRVDLPSLPGQKNRASAYALSYVYSPDERTVLLMIHKSRPLRLWVNGEFVEDYVPGEYPVQPHYEHFHRVPIVLHSGRNTILVKTNTPDFYVRIGDTPRDRAILLAEQQRFAEAAQVFNQLTPADQLDLSGVLPSILANVLALEGNHEQHERLCAALIAWAEPQPASTRHAVAYFCAQTQNHVFDVYAELLVAYADEYAAANREQWVLLYTALVNYRAGRYERASTLLNEANWNTHDLPLRAMLAHQSGKRELAQKTLDEALAAGEVDESFLKEHNRTEFYGKQHFCWWYDWATFVTLLTEAEQTIRGQTTQSDGLKQRCEAIMAQKWAESPETAPFDQAMLFASRDGAGQVKYGQPYLARGKRLAALSRFDEAEADFNKAVELAPTDPDVLTRRALFFAERDDPQRAAADFDAALTLIEKQNPPRWLWGRTIDAEVAGRASVYDALQALRPTDGQLLSIRIISRLRNGERESLAAPCRQLEQFGFQPYLAAVHLLRGDRVEFERLLATDAGDAYHRTLLGGLAPTDETMARRLLAAAEELERQGPHDRWQRRWIGLAQLRASRLEEAKTTLLGCLDSQSAWQTDSIVWPLLAITCHQLGETAESQRWWQKSEIWLRTLERLPPAEWSRVVVRGFSFEEWLLACVFHREAKALIETAADPTQPLPASVPE